MSLVKTALSSLKNIHFLSLLGNVIMAAFGMLVIAMLFRALSVNDAGVYFFFMVLYNLVDTLKTGFFTNAFITFYTGTSTERAKEVAGSSWTLALIISGLLIVVNIPSYFIASYLGNDATALYIKYFSIVALSTLPSFMANLVVQGDKRFDRLLWLRLVNQLLYIGSIIALMYLKQATLDNILIAFTVTNFIASFIIMLFGWTRVSDIKYTTRKTMTEMFHFGKYSMGTSLSSTLFRVTDTFFINYYLGAPALAVYNLGSRFMPIVEMPILSFASSSMTLLAEYYNTEQKERMMYVLKKLIGMLSICIFVIALLAIIFANPLIILIGGPKYIGSQAPNLFRIFISIAVLFPADRLFALTLDIIKKPKINFYKILIMLAVNLIADFIGVSIFHSVYAIALTNIFPVLVAICISYVPLNEFYKFSFWSMYHIGYNELIILIKQFYNSISGKETTINS